MYNLSNRMVPTLRTLIKRKARTLTSPSRDELEYLLNPVTVSTSNKTNTHIYFWSPPRGGISIYSSPFRNSSPIEPGSSYSPPLLHASSTLIGLPLDSNSASHVDDGYGLDGSVLVYTG